MPCNYLFTEWGYTGDSVHEECIWDLKAQQEYIGGQIQLYLYFNDEHYEPAMFEDDSIRKESKIVKYYISDQQPSYFYQFVQTQQLNDRTSYFQLEDPNVIDFYNHLTDNIIMDSTWNQYPTKLKPLGRYKFFSFFLSRDPTFR